MVHDMKNILAAALLFMCSLVGAQTFPVHNLTVSGTSSFTGTMSGAGLVAHDANVSHVQTVLNVSALRSTNCVPGLIYQTQGYFSIADSGDGSYVCNGSDTTSADNGGSIIAAANSYRFYLLILDGSGNTTKVAQWGALPSASDSSPALTAAYASGSKIFQYPVGSLNINSPLTPPASSTHIGMGRYATFLSAVFTGGNVGAPMFSFPAGERPSVRDMTFNANYTAAGILMTNSYLNLIQNGAFIGFKGYAIKMVHTATSLISNNDFLYVSPMTSTEVGVICSDGSANDIRNNRFSHQGIGVQGDTVYPSGANITLNNFGPLYIGVQVPLGSVAWNIDYNYFESGNSITQQPVSIGQAGSGANIPNVSFSRNIVAQTLDGTSVFDNVDNLIVEGNFTGATFQYNSGILDMFEADNKYIATPTRNYARNVRSISGALYSTNGLNIQNSVGQGSIVEDSGISGTLLASLNSAGSSYAPMSIDALIATIRLSGSTTNKYTFGVNMYTPGAVYPGSPGASAQQTNYGILEGTGAPNNTYGNNGDFYFRGDTPAVALQRIYIKTAGAWVGIL